jgi:hypothetical protein
MPLLCCGMQLTSACKTAAVVDNHNASLLVQQAQNQAVLGLPLVCIAQNCGLRCGAAGSLLYPAGPVNMPSCMRRCSCFSAAVLDAGVQQVQLPTETTLDNMFLSGCIEADKYHPRQTGVWDVSVDICEAMYRARAFRATPEQSGCTIRGRRHTLKLLCLWTVLVVGRPSYNMCYFTGAFLIWP